MAHKLKLGGRPRLLSMTVLLLAVVAPAVVAPAVVALTVFAPLRAVEQSAPAASSQTQTQPPDNSFTDQVAAQLLDQMASGLTAHNQRRALEAFDLTRMKDGARFRQQINSFLAQAGTVRIHYNQLRVSMEGGRGVTSAMMEMEIDSRDDTGIARYKRAQLRLQAENTASGWKFTEVQPREFFSTQP